jgi:DNA-binding MarR family transcriptional regulator
MVTQAEASQEISRLLPSVAIYLRLAALFDLEAADLTANQVLTLIVVSTAEGGRMKAGEIANRLAISFPAATALVDRLVVAGVLERSQGADRRVVWVSLTEAGRGLVSRLRAGLESRIDSVVAKMEPAAVQALLEALQRVAGFVELIDDADGPRPAAPAAPGSSRQPVTVAAEHPP